MVALEQYLVARITNPSIRLRQMPPESGRAAPHHSRMFMRVADSGRL